MPPFAVHCVVGEEDGGLGAYATLVRGHTGRACVIPEPTDLGLVTANAGSLTFRLEVPGLATHGSTAYAGVSAIDAYLPLHAALARLSERRNRVREPLLDHLPGPLPAVGRPAAGRRLGQQRARPARRRGPLRPAGRGGPGRRAGRAGGRGRRGGGRAPVPARPPAGGHLAGRPVRAAGTCRPGTRSRPRSARRTPTVTGGEVPGERGAPWGSDLRLYAGAGVPTLHYGPGDVRLAHGPDENVPLAQVETTAAVFVDLLRTGVA